MRQGVSYGNKLVRKRLTKYLSKNIRSLEETRNKIGGRVQKNYSFQCSRDFMGHEGQSYYILLDFPVSILTSFSDITFFLHTYRYPMLKNSFNRPI